MVVSDRDFASEADICAQRIRKQKDGGRRESCGSARGIGGFDVAAHDGIAQTRLLTSGQRASSKADMRSITFWQVLTHFRAHKCQEEGTCVGNNN